MLVAAVLIPTLMLNPYIALSILLGGLVLVATLIISLYNPCRPSWDKKSEKHLNKG
jgi:membrane protein implicated in regulation of membrane protease activity